MWCFYFVCRVLKRLVQAAVCTPCCLPKSSWWDAYLQLFEDTEHDRLICSWFLLLTKQT